MQSARIRRFSHCYETYLNVIICALGLFHCTCSAETWHTEVIDEALVFSGFPDRGFVSDAFGTQHLLVEGNRLIYARCPDGGDWIQEEIAPSPYGQDASMAIDDAGNPHVAFYDPSQKRLYYAFRDESGWRIERVGDIEQAGRFNSICLDLNGNPVISFLAHTPLRLCVAHLLAYGWDVETIDGVEVYESPTSVGVGGDGVINIMVTPISDDVAILLIRGRSRDWTFHPVPGVNSIQCDPILRVNKVAGPFIIYVSYRFSCAVWKNDHFDVESMPRGLNEYNFTVDLTPSGFISVCCRNKCWPDKLDLILAIRANSEWSTATYQMEFDYSSINRHCHFVDSHFALNIACMTDYLIQGYLRLDVIEDVLTTLDRKTITQGYIPRTPCVATQCPNDRFHIAYIRNGTNQVMYMVCENGEWSQDSVYQANPGVEIGSVSLTLSLDDQPAICHTDSGYLYLSVKSGDEWNREVISKSDIINGQMEYDRDAREHVICFYKNTTSEIAIGYAQRLEDGEWGFEEMSRNVQCPNPNSRILAIDELNQPNVLYKSPVYGYKNDLNLAVKRGDEWSIQKIGDLYTMSKDIELMIDSCDNYNILYTFYQNTPGDHQTCYELRSCSNPSEVISKHETLMYNGGSLYISPTMQWSILGYESGLKHVYGFGATGSRECHFPSMPYAIVDHVLDSNDILHSAIILDGDHIGLHYFRLKPESNCVRLQTRSTSWTDGGDLFAVVYHDSLDTVPAALVVAMQFGDRFWFYPSWTEEFHAHPILLLPAKYGAEYMIVNHSFTTDAEFHLTFWAALLTPDLTQIIGGDNGIDSIDITCSPG